jgi:hypothetical protein
VVTQPINITQLLVQNGEDNESTTEEDEDDNILVDDEDFKADDLSEIIELSALQWTELALSMSGDGSHGPYNQFPKSTNFFSTSLQALD